MIDGDETVGGIGGNFVSIRVEFAVGSASDVGMVSVCDANSRKGWVISSDSPL